MATYCRNFSPLHMDLCHRGTKPMLIHDNLHEKIPSVEYHCFQVLVWCMSWTSSHSEAEMWLWRRFETILLWKKRQMCEARGKYLNRFLGVFPLMNHSLTHTGHLVSLTWGPRNRIQSFGQQWYSWTGVSRCWMIEKALLYVDGNEFPEGRMKKWRMQRSRSSTCLLIPGNEENQENKMARVPKTLRELPTKRWPELSSAMPGSSTYGKPMSKS